MNQYNFANNLGFKSENNSEKAENYPLYINNLTLSKNPSNISKSNAPQFSLDIKHGEVFCLICPNLNEKNTLSDTLSGILPPENGSIEINGCDLYSDRVSALSYMGVARPDMKFYPELTAYENLLLVARLRNRKSLIYPNTSESDTSAAPNVSPETAVDQAARLTDLEEILRNGTLFGTRTGKLGDAERAKLIFAAAIVGRPPLLIIDSPLLLAELSSDPQSKIGKKQKLGLLGRARKTVAPTGTLSNNLPGNPPQSVLPETLNITEFTEITQITDFSGEFAERLSLLIKYISSLGTAVLIIDSRSGELPKLLSRNTRIGIMSGGSFAAIGTADEIAAGSITDSTTYEIVLAVKPDADTVKSAEAILLSLGHRSFSIDDSGRLLINVPNRDREKTVAWIIRMLIERSIDICSVTPLYKSGLDIVIGELCKDKNLAGANGNDTGILVKTLPKMKNVKGENRNDE